MEMTNTVLLEEIKNKIKNLAEKHIQCDDDSYDEAELIEIEVENTVVEYCQMNNYLINGFPTEMRKLPLEELEEDYFCRERFQFYLDTLATQHEDVLELMWCYVSNFWEDQFESKENYIEMLKEALTSEIYYEKRI